MINKLQLLLNVAARLFASTSKYGRALTHLLYTELHCLDMKEGVKFCVVAAYVYVVWPLPLWKNFANRWRSNNRDSDFAQ